jgi:hypothetical protein
MEKKEKSSQFVIIKKDTKKENETKPHEIRPQNPDTRPQKTDLAPASLKPENKKRGPFSMLLGEKITIQAAKSSVLYTGEFIDYIDGFFILKNAKIFGTKHNVEVDTLIINRNQIAHIHTEPKSVEEKK